MDSSPTLVTSIVANRVQSNIKNRVENSVIPDERASSLIWICTVCKDIRLQSPVTKYFSHNPVCFVCVEVLRPSQPNGVMSSAVSLPNHTFTGQA